MQMFRGLRCNTPRDALDESMDRERVSVERRTLSAERRARQLPTPETARFRSHPP